MTESNFRGEPSVSIFLRSGDLIRPFITGESTLSRRLTTPIFSLCTAKIYLLSLDKGEKCESGDWESEPLGNGPNNISFHWLYVQVGLLLVQIFCKFSGFGIDAVGQMQMYFHRNSKVSIQSPRRYL